MKRDGTRRALQRGSVLDAISAAKAMGGLSLGDALAMSARAHG
jgi:hypothetical protein